MKQTQSSGLLDIFTSDKEELSRKIVLSDLWIQTKDKSFVRFKPNPVQIRYLNELCPGWRDGDYSIQGKREIILKARQFGFSTLILAIFFLNTINNADVHTVVVADTSENTATLFEKVRHFYEHLPEHLKPTKRYSSKSELVFGRLRSAFRVLTAGSKDVGHSKTIHQLHCSEVALWSTEEVFTGLLQPVPASGTVFIESTAQGEGGVYHTEYVKAEKGESPFSARFFPWFAHDEYRQPPPPNWTPKPDTRLILSTLPIDEEQAYWWECKRSEPGMGNLIGSQYPNNSKDAFRVAGTTFFTEWDESRHVIAPHKVPYGYRFEGSLDWGFGKQFGFLLNAFGWFGEVVVLQELYAKRVLNTEQARLICEVLEEWEIPKEECEIHCDPNMWNVITNANDGTSYRDIDAFEEAGLVCVRALNKRTQSSRGGTGSGGWDNVRQYLTDDVLDKRTGELLPRLRVFATCENLIRVMPMMKHSKTNPEDMESDPTKVEDHLPDCLRYLLNAHILVPKSPGERIMEALEGYDMGKVDVATGKRSLRVQERVFVHPSHGEGKNIPPWVESESRGGIVVGSGAGQSEDWSY